MPINSCLGKEDIVCLCNAVLFSHKKEWNFTFCNNMDGPRGYHAKWNESDKEKHMISLICGI